MSVKSKDPYIIVFFCLLAALRVFIYSAAFPFFSNVDEEAHFDMVMKHYECNVPRTTEAFSTPSAIYIAAYSSPEYGARPDSSNSRLFDTPPLKMSSFEGNRIIHSRFGSWISIQNHESSHWSVYYPMVALALKILRHADPGGFDLGDLYGLRWLNIFFIVSLTCLAYLIAKNVFPGNRLMIIGAPLVTALWPQDIYYTIQSDVLSPVLYGATLLFLLRFIRAEKPRLSDALLTAAFLVATILVKASNFPLPLVVIPAFVHKVWQFLSRKQPAIAYSALSLFVCGLMPLLIWLLWNYATFGDLTGSERKIAVMGWTRKPFTEWFTHPFFSLRGIGHFWRELWQSFWRGELIWHTERIANSFIDTFYWTASTLLLTAGIFLHKKKRPDPDVITHRIFTWSLLSLLLFLVFLSISLDFGNKHFYPSPQLPYFTSGRLLSAAFLPAVFLVLKGVQRLSSRVASQRLQLTFVAATAISLSIAELFLHLPVFSSAYNYFNY